MSSAVEAAAPASLAEVVDTEALLAPIAGDNPSGQSLRHSEIYDKIERARQSDDDFEKGDWKSAAKAADWEQVEALAVDALARLTKDLKICAWMTEALIINYGFVGLRDGLKVMRGLHQNFWETLYPEIDRGDVEETEDDGAPAITPEEDLTARVNSLTLLDKLAADAIKDVSLTQSRGGSDYSFTQWEGSKQFVVPDNLAELDPSEVERINAMREEAAAERKITSDDWNKAKAATPFTFYQTTLTTLDECLAEYKTLNAVIDERYQRDAPSLRALEKTLDDIHTQIERIYKEKRPPDVVANDGKETGGGAAESDGGGAAAEGLSVGGSTRTRQEALRKLSEVADYFRRTEPHSPVSYLVQRAIKWGQMPLEAWLEDVVKDPGVLDSMRETLGLKSSPDAGAPDNGDDAASAT